MEHILGIGSTIWYFDINCRVYKKAENGRSTGGPIYRHHWRETTIVGETSRSWITNRDVKIPKKGPAPNGYCLTQQCIDDDCWRARYRYRIGSRVEHCHDVEKLRAIADILGWAPDVDDE